jgi:hypothetical protein
LYVIGEEANRRDEAALALAWEVGPRRETCASTCARRAGGLAVQ